MNEDIKTFVKEALGRGTPRAEITKILEQAGWHQDEIAAGLRLYADVAFPVAVPRRRAYLSAREAFVYLLMFVCLYLSAYNFGALLFYFINTGIPDPLRYYEGIDPGSLRRSVASLVVAFPIFFWLSTLTAKWARLDPDKKGSKIRKWLTYLTLFVAAGVIIGDLIVLLYNLLGGELTARFILKVVTVLVIAGLVFGYYLWDLRGEEKGA